MKMDELVVESESKQRDTGKRGAKMLGKEKEKKTSTKKLKMQEEHTDKCLEQQNVRNNKKNKKDKAASAFRVQNSLLKQIDTLTSDTLANCLPNDNVC